MVTEKQLNAGIAMVKAVADTVKELGRVPSGVVYSAMMTHGVSFEGYQKIVAILVRGGLIREESNQLVWIG
jgi:hypothetical protein